VRLALDLVQLLLYVLQLVAQLFERAFIKLG
jgi:hypothetical protein